MNKYLEKIAELSHEDIKSLATGYDSYTTKGSLGAIGGGLVGGLVGGKAGAAIGAGVGGLGRGYLAYRQNRRLNEMLEGKDKEKVKAVKRMLSEHGEQSVPGRVAGNAVLGLVAGPGALLTGTAGGIESHLYNKKLRKALHPDNE